MFLALNAGCDDGHWDSELSKFQSWLDAHRIHWWVIWLQLYRISWYLHWFVAMIVIMAIFSTGIMRPIVRSIYVCTHGRRLCRTGHGDLVLAPCNTKTGDVVAVLFGLDWPVHVVLRKVENGAHTMSFVGEACMPAVDSLSCEDIYRKPEQIWLR